MGNLAGWPYWKVISITGQSGAGIDYPVELTIGDSAGGDFHLEGHCTNFPQDIRITDDDGTTLLDHFVEDLTADPIIVRVKVNDDLGSNRDIRVYYGKSGEITASDIDTTFLFGDDFSGDLAKWDTWSFGEAGTIDIVGGSLRLLPAISNDRGVAASTTATPLTNDFAIEYSRKNLTSGTARNYIGCTFGTGNIVNHPAPAYYIGGPYNGYSVWVHSYNNIGPYHEWATGSPSETMTLDANAPEDDNFHNNIIIYKNNGVIEYYIDGTLTAHSSDTTFLSDNKKIGLCNGRYDSSWNSIGYIDFIIGRKYKSPEPAFSSAGSEETDGATEVYLTLSQNLSTSRLGQANAQGPVILSNTLATIDGGGANSQSVLSLNNILSISILAEALASAGISLNMVESIITNGTLVSITVTTPEGRTVIIGVEIRTEIIPNEDRTVRIPQKSRITTI